MRNIPTRVLLWLSLPVLLVVAFLVGFIFKRDTVRWLWTFERIDIGDRIESAIDWIGEKLSAVFDFIRSASDTVIERLADILGTPSALVFALIATVLVILLRSVSFSSPFVDLQGVLGALPLALFTFLSFRLVDAMNQWSNFTGTFALILIATVLAVIIAVPVGIAAAHHRLVSVIVRPVLDFMQTLPVFVYLLPAVAFLRTGVPPGLFATLVFAIPPGVRLTELGIRQVDEEVVEAAEAYGATKRQLLWGVKMPLALPTIMQGVNQVIMLALSMVVVAAMIGAGGLGGDVVTGLSTLQLSLGFESGLAVVVMAIFLDRVTTVLRDRAQVKT